MKKHLILTWLGVLSVHMLTTAYGDDASALKIVSDGKTIGVKQQEVGKKREVVFDQGYSRSNPILIDVKKVNHYDDLQSIQREYLEKNYPGYEWVGPNTVKEQGQFLQQVTFRTEEGKLESLFFDVTPCFKKLKQKDKQLKKQIEFHEKAALKTEELIKNQGITINDDRVVE